MKIGVSKIDYRFLWIVQGIHFKQKSTLVDFRKQSKLGVQLPYLSIYWKSNENLLKRA